MKKFIKGFDENLCCRDTQFEIGKTYEIKNEEGTQLKLCSDTAFHFCKTLQQVHRFYNVHPEIKNRFCEIEVLGELVESKDKCGSNKIRIVKEIKGKKLNELRGLINGNVGLFNAGNDNAGNNNTGDRNAGNYNAGDRNAGNRNVGHYNTGNDNTGHYNTGNDNTGHDNTDNNNTGNYNTGHDNAGNRNAGNRNVGHYNTGNDNTGNDNTGHDNAGNRNTGHYNTGNDNTGLFNTVQPTLSIFNEDSGMTYEQCKKTKWFELLFWNSLELTEWILYTDEEMKKSPIRQCIRGYLKEIPYKEACANWWNDYNDEDKLIIQSMPNFDKKIFKEITGIEL